MGDVKLRVFFENDQAWVNRAYDEFLPQYLLRAEYTFGTYSTDKIDGKNLYLKGDTRQARLGTTLKAIGDYHKFASANSITKPPRLKVMTFETPNSQFNGMAPMARWNSRDLFDIITGILGQIGTISSLGAVGLLHDQLPDLLIYVGSSNRNGTMTEGISEVVYHEMAHASHAYANGNDFGNLWWTEWAQMISNGGGYAETPLVDLVESWGYFIGYYLTAERFPSLKTRYIARQLEDADLATKSEGFFLDLIDGTSSEPTPYTPTFPNYLSWDNCEGYSVAQIFSVLGKNSIRSLGAFRDSFVSQYSMNQNSTDQINEVLKGNWDR